MVKPSLHLPLGKVTDTYTVPTCPAPPFSHTESKSIIGRLWTPEVGLCLIYLCFPEASTMYAYIKKVPDNWTQLN